MSAVIYYCNFEIPGRKRAADEIVENVLTLPSISRTIKKYSPPSEWIMCELCVSQFFRERSFKSRQNLRVDYFFNTRKDFEGFKTAFFHLL